MMTPKTKKQPKEREKRLALKKERLRDLTPSELAVVVGGGPISKLSTAYD